MRIWSEFYESEKGGSRLNRNDKILIGVLLAISIFSFGIKVWFAEAGTEAFIMVNGATYGTYALNKNQKIKIHSSKDKENVIVIKEGQVYMESASCKDLICVHQRKIKKIGETIICLPNKVMIEVIGDDEEVDIITR